MRSHTKLRAFELADEVRPDSVRAQRLTAFSLQPKHLSSYICLSIEFTRRTLSEQVDHIR